MPEIIYLIFFLITILAASMVVFSRHAVYSAMYLVLMMVSIAGIFVLINAQLAAVLQILVYAGAIMVLFLFVIMLLNLGHMPEPPLETVAVRRVGAALAGILLIQSAAVTFRWTVPAPAPGRDPAHSASISEVALALMTDYLYAFEATSVLLLVAIIGSILLGRKSVSVASVREWQAADAEVAAAGAAHPAETGAEGTADAGERKS